MLHKVLKKKKKKKKKIQNVKINMKCLKIAIVFGSKSGFTFIIKLHFD